MRREKQSLVVIKVCNDDAVEFLKKNQSSREQVSIGNADEYKGAYCDGNLVGVVGILKFNTSLRIKSLYIQKEYRRMGIATQLLDAVVDDCECTAYSTVNSVHVFERRGFRCKDTNKHGISYMVKPCTNLKKTKVKKFKSPVYSIKRVPIDKIQANTYNPNHVAPPEMKLLYDSIKEDGYTMPIVCYYLEDIDKYEIVDGYHRYTTMLLHKDIYDREGGCLPVSIIDKPLANRMTSTVRHNRARGSHDIDLMVNIVAELHSKGMSDTWIMKHLGMDAEELLRLKQLSGLAELFKNEEFSQSLDGE